MPRPIGPTAAASPRGRRHGVCRVLHGLCAVHALRPRPAARRSPRRWAGTAGTPSAATSPRRRSGRRPTPSSPRACGTLGYRYVGGGRLLVQPEPRLGREPAGDPTRFPSGMQGPRRLPARQGPEVRHLPGAGAKDLRPVLRQLPRRHRQPGPRGAGRPPVRRVGRGLPQVRLVLPERHHQRPGRAFARMRDALAATGRPIVYSINPNSIHAKTGPQRNWGDVAEHVAHHRGHHRRLGHRADQRLPDGHPEHRQRHRAAGRRRRARGNSTTRT